MGASKILFRNLVVALIALVFTACTTLRPLQSVSPATIRQQVAPGDEVRITTQRGEVYELTVMRLDSEALVGRNHVGKTFSIHYAAIQQMEVPQVDAGKTFWQSLGTLGVLLVLATVVASVKIADDLHDAD